MSEETVNLETATRSEKQIGSLWTALANAQTEIQNVSKNRIVKVRMKSGGEYSYAYATLDAVLDTIRIPLAKNGISVVQLIVQTPKGNWMLRTVIGHSSGDELVSEMPVFVESENSLRAMQSFGSAVTFARRYSLQNLFMLAADEDDDANDGAEIKPKSARTNDLPPKQESKPKKTPAIPPGEANQTKDQKDDPSEKYVVPFGKFKGQSIDAIPVDKLVEYVDYLTATAARENKPMREEVRDFVTRSENLIASLGKDAKPPELDPSESVPW